MNPLVAVAVLLAGAQAGYLRLVRYFGIIDRPNDRSSHTIFRAHRLHLFQLLVDKLNWPHLHVSAGSANR